MGNILKRWLTDNSDNTYHCYTNYINSINLWDRRWTHQSWNNATSSQKQIIFLYSLHVLSRTLCNEIIKSGKKYAIWAITIIRQFVRTFDERRVFGVEISGTCVGQHDDGFITMRYRRLITSFEINWKNCDLIWRCLSFYCLSDLARRIFSSASKLDSGDKLCNASGIHFEYNFAQIRHVSFFNYLLSEN